MALRGYKPLGGSSRKYRAPGGKIISRREYDNIRAQQAGWKNRYELEQFRAKVQRSRWGDWVYDVKQHSGKMPTFETYADLREVQQRRKELERQNPGVTGNNRDQLDKALVDANGPLARILDASGRRPLNGRPVGDS